MGPPQASGRLAALALWPSRQTFRQTTRRRLGSGLKYTPQPSRRSSGLKYSPQGPSKHRKHTHFPEELHTQFPGELLWRPLRAQQIREEAGLEGLKQASQLSRVA